MRFHLPASIHTGPLRGCLCVGGGAAVCEIWPYKPVAHSSARRYPFPPLRRTSIAGHPLSAMAAAPSLIRWSFHRPGPLP